MSKINSKKRVYLVILVSLVLATLACRVEAPKIVLSDEPTAQPTMVITQVVTQVITPTPPPPPTATIAPSPTPEPTLTPTFDPVNAPVYYPLENCVASRLHVGDIAMVSLFGGPNGIRYGLDVHFDTILYYAEPGEELYIVDGPWCSHGWIVWMVETKNGVRGYTPEGDGNSYWLLPVR